MPLSPFQLPLYGLPNEVGTVLAVLQNRVHAVKCALGEAGWRLFVVDLLSSHTTKIGDITNCFKGYFCRYHLLTYSGLLISSIHQQRESDMAKQTFKIGDKVVDRGGFKGVIRKITEWKGSHWYDVRFAGGEAVRYDGDLRLDA